nr:putative integron gene cassette protein [uncultured bacterium]
MCISLILEAEFRSFDDWKLLQHEVAAATGNSGLRLRGLRLKGEPTSKTAPPRHLSLVSRENGCGCELVEPGAGSSDSLWRFLPEVYAQLPLAISAIIDHAISTVRFTPYWLGFESEFPRKESIKISEFAIICETAKLPADAEFTIVLA